MFYDLNNAGLTNIQKKIRNQEYYDFMSLLFRVSDFILVLLDLNVVSDEFFVTSQHF